MELPFRKIKRNKHNILDSVAFRTVAFVFLFIPIDIYVPLHRYIFIGSRELQDKPNHEQSNLKQVQENLFPSTAACTKAGQKLIQHVKQVFNATLINQFSYNYIQIPCVNMLDKWLWNTELIKEKSSSYLLLKFVQNFKKQNFPLSTPNMLFMNCNLISFI